MTRAGTPAQSSDLVDVDALLAAYHDRVPDLDDPAQRVVFGTSGHRGSSLDGAFTDTHIAAITQAIVEYRATQGTTGPIFVGADTHALSIPAQRTALEVLTANGVAAFVDANDGYVPTPALSHAIITHNRSGLADADGIVITPSHNPPRDGGFKYNPPHGGPADSDATNWIADRANAIIADGSRDVKRGAAIETHAYDYRLHYVADLAYILDIDRIREAGLHIGADPLGGASVEYWQFIAEHYGIDLTVVNPFVDPAWAFMTLDWDERIRMDPSSPSAMASVVARRHDFDLLTGNDADDRDQHRRRHRPARQPAHQQQPHQHDGGRQQGLLDDRGDRRDADREEDAREHRPREGHRDARHRPTEPRPQPAHDDEQPAHQEGADGCTVRAGRALRRDQQRGTGRRPREAQGQPEPPRQQPGQHGLRDAQHQQAARRLGGARSHRDEARDHEITDCP